MNSSEKIILHYIKVKDKYKKVIMLYPETDVETTQFDLSIEKKTELVDSGRREVKKYL